jgi:hypothetical protein
MIGNAGGGMELLEYVDKYTEIALNYLQFEMDLIT